RDTMIGLASRLVISQPDAVSNMAVPTFDMTLAVHMTVNTTWLKGPHREGTGWVGAAEELRFALTLVSSAQRFDRAKRPSRLSVNQSASLAGKDEWMVVSPCVLKQGREIVEVARHIGMI